MAFSTVRSPLAWFVFAVLFAGSVLPLQAQLLCDESLKVLESDALGYQARDDRCEGLYVREVSGSLSLVSLHFSSPSNEFGPTVSVSWSADSESAQGQTRTRLRVLSTKPRTYYRMDTVRPAEELSYVWPTNLLQKTGLKRRDIGILKWAEGTKGTNSTRVYSPVSIDSHTGPIEVTLLPTAKLEEVYVSIVPVDEDGSEEAYVWEAEPLEQFYSARQPITFKLPPEPGPGRYRMEIDAEFATGGTTYLETHFWIPDPK